MKKTFIALFLLSSVMVMAQKPRPDAFAPLPDTSLSPKAVDMATTLDEMDAWNRYPTYEVYVAMMQRFADNYPDLCHLDTIGTSIQGRLILSLAITGSALTDNYRPEFFYSSTMHGDEVTGFYLMLRLCDTLLRSYGISQDITSLLDRTRICINPLSNPDGTYHGGNSTVARAWRYNSDYVDLNRNYPDPFGTDPLEPLQPENEAMIDYVSQHNFRLSANLHGGSEVMNYPWDSFTSSQQLNEHSEWWKEVCKRFVDTCRLVDSQRFRDVNSRGYINGGDWYVIHNGRQDYFNYYHNMRELTMELSTSKTLSTTRLNHYWQCQSQALINYIKEIHNLDDTSAVGICPQPQPKAENICAYPNPTTGSITVQGLYGSYHYDLSDRPSGVYILNVEGRPVKVVKH
ncbi:MAG: hypothetical protein IKG81_01915 [Bacteroidales bacterium]|nr:hypothetical protein [Bacteroidales bacterium]